MKKKLIIISFTSKFVTALILIFFISSGLLLSTSNKNKVRTQSKTLEKKIDRHMAQLPDEFNGTILLSIGNEILFNKGYGMADRSANISNTIETKFEIASLTKDFTTILVFKLIEMGELKLTDRISKFIPEYPNKEAGRITIHQLLLHRSGIKNHMEIPGFIAGKDRIRHTRKELLELFWEDNLAHDPGKSSTYSSSNYWLLAIIMERMTGKSFSELLKKFIFKPLGMNNTFVGNNLTPLSNMAIGYKRGILGFVKDFKEQHSTTLGAGDLITTTTDLYKFLKILSLKSEQILSLDSKKELFQEQWRINRYLVRTNLATLAYLPYSSGKNILRIFGVSAGGNYGFQARMTRLLDFDATYIVLSNTHNDRCMTDHSLYNFLQDILCEKLDIPLKSYIPLKEIKIKDKNINPEMKKITGIYKLNKNNILHFYFKDGTLNYRNLNIYSSGNIQVRGGKLFALGNNRFYDINDWYPQEFLFIKPSEINKSASLSKHQHLFNKSKYRNKYNILRKRFNSFQPGFRFQPEAVMKPDITGFEGSYYSVELQKTYSFLIRDNKLYSKDFLDEKAVFFDFIKPDVFLCKQGYLVFHRYKEGLIRDFYLMSENLDFSYGSLFVKQ